MVDLWIRVAILALSVAVMATCIRCLLLTRRSRTWPTTSATFISNQVETEDGTHEVKVKYAYEIDGQRHECDRIRFGGMPGMWRRRNADALSRRYAVGTRADVRVDPDDRTRAVLEPRISSQVVAGLVFTTVSALAIVIGFARGRGWI